MKVFLTFDCEDFINPQATCALNWILELLQKYDLRAIFFLTGHMCEKLKSHPEILDLLEKHEIGYHSTSHSVHPGIFEYTDIENYAEARKLSLERETARINPLTGETEGKGGFLLLKDLFPNKRVVSFRAPGFCWSPPNLEALEKLGIQFDFSTNLSTIPILYRNITFYPFPILGFEILLSSVFPLGKLSGMGMARLMGKSVSSRPVVFFIHPHDFVNAEDWDYDYFAGNPKQLRLIQTKSWQETRNTLRSFELFLRRVSFLANKEVLEVTPSLQEGISKTRFTKEQALQSYGRSIQWAKRLFNYTPKFLLRHFFEYFDTKA
jgi:hypothetical protein